jgi:outer membrane lipoprotein carrier protein
MITRTVVHNSLQAAVKSISKFLPQGAATVALVVGLVCTGAADTGTEQLQRFLGGLHSFQADFEQVLLDESGAPIEEAKGTLVLARPGRFRWDYREPYPQLIVADGKHVWIYDTELAQVTVKELGEAVGDTPTLLLTSDSSLEKRFLMQSAGKRDGLEWVSLEPKSSDVSFSEIRLGLERGELTRMELVDSFGQTTELYFHNIVKNAKVRPELFSFTPPAGVDVIGDRPAIPQP